MFALAPGERAQDIYYIIVNNTLTCYGTLKMSEMKCMVLTIPAVMLRPKCERETSLLFLLFNIKTLLKSAD